VSKLAIISIEGVLSQEADLRRSAPQKWAVPLYEAIRSQFRTMALTAAPEPLARDWLRKENLSRWSGVKSWNQVMSYEDWKVDTLRQFLADGFEVGFLLDVDYSVLMRAGHLGVLTMAMTPPHHRPGWKSPDHGFQPWAELVDTVEQSS
jgi:hypothetical protein